MTSSTRITLEMQLHKERYKKWEYERAAKIIEKEREEEKYMAEHNFLENKRKERMNRSYIDESEGYNSGAVKYA